MHRRNAWWTIVGAVAMVLACKPDKTLVATSMPLASLDSSNDLLYARRINVIGGCPFSFTARWGADGGEVGTVMLQLEERVATANVTGGVKRDDGRAIVTTYCVDPGIFKGTLELLPDGGINLRGMGEVVCPAEIRPGDTLCSRPGIEPASLDVTHH